MASKKATTTTTLDPTTGIQVPALPTGASTGSTHQDTKATRNAADAPVGIPVTSHVTVDPVTGASSTTYSSNWVPSMWIDGVGPQARAANRPFDAKPGDAGSDLPNKQPDGTSDWYRNSDTYAPAQGDPASIEAIQQQMIQAGLLDPSTVHWGLWGASDQTAYLTVLQQSNQYGVSADKMLPYLASHPNTPTVQLANPIDVNAVADSVIPQVLGRTLTKGEKSKLVDAWHKVQADTAAATPTGGPGQTSQTAAPSLTDFATSYEEEQNPGDFAHHAQTTALGWIHNALQRTTAVST